MVQSKRFVCDEMLKGLARWLRAAGYDTVVCSDGTRDADILAFAREEGRVLLTRDRRFLERRDAGVRVIVLYANGIESCARELTKRLSVDWKFRPFSRCLICNSAIEPVVASRRTETPLPPENYEPPRELYYCPRCEKFYWEGSHVARMRATLTAWQRGARIMNNHGC